MPDLKETSEKGSRKYMLMFTLPSGTRMAASAVGTNFVLVPLSKHTADSQFLVWDTPRAVGDFFKDLKEKNPDKHKEIWALRPQIIPVIVEGPKIFLDTRKQLMPEVPPNLVN